jgi:hypothetical protein
VTVPQRLGAHARALFVALHLLAITAMAMPSAGLGLNRRAWKDPTVQGEFAAWTERLGGWGIDLTVPELEDLLWGCASGYEEVRDAVLEPFQPYFRHTGTWQSWKMFVAPHRYPSRLEIEVDRGNGFEPVFVERSATAEWMRPWFDHDRMRSAVFRYGWAHYRTSRGVFADWVYERALDDFDDVRAVRVVFVKYRTPSPADVRAGVPAEENRDLAEVRPRPEPRRDGR